MVIDSSALVAILLLEPEAADLAHALTRDEEKLLSSATYVETSMVLVSRNKDKGLAEMERFIAVSHIKTSA